MPQELPGFYYDPERNRYFPLKGPIPGTTAPSRKLLSNPKRANNVHRRVGIRISSLLQDRELCGNAITFNKGKCNFQEECQKLQVSQPVVCKYQGTDRTGDAALEQLRVDVLTEEGQRGADVLLTGSGNGLLNFLEVGNVGEDFDYGEKHMPDCVWPLTIGNRKEANESLRHVWRWTGGSLLMPSNIAWIKMPGRRSSYTADDVSNTHHALIGTLGSDASRGSVYFLNLREPLDFNPTSQIMAQRICEVVSFNGTVWTGDYNPNRYQAVIGTNLGAALVNLETKVTTWVCRSKSDVMSLQFDQSGNVVLCGFRNGAIVTLDVRQKQEASSARLTEHKICYSSNTICEHSKIIVQNSRKQCFKLKGNIYPSQTICMPSAICCLESLQFYDQYFLASSMDGSIKLYDHRLMKKGALQSYEGHVNSHTRMQLGVDPSERFVMSGGEDCYLRIWRIKSGELLFEDKFSDSVLSTVCWTRFGRNPSPKMQNYEEYQHGQTHNWGAWLGSYEGLFHIQ
ncbi:uncharacterized protein LOC131160472 [Malania oleifera]|uniref:uncharacterized protein LOC131160472 n=1 Tax=Malania oleifera TaxID=397392 RepID=UPI0025ADDB90|nr:uncharacterized protein LOC131160472 [Malania oleifera]